MIPHSQLSTMNTSIGQNSLNKKNPFEYIVPPPPPPQVKQLKYYCSLFVLYYFLQVANLFARDEIDEICNDLIPVMKKELPKKAPTPENLYEYFISRARKNLHVVLCFSPVNFFLTFMKRFIYCKFRFEKFLFFMNLHGSLEKHTFIQ